MIVLISTLIAILCICYVCANRIVCETITWDKLPENIRIGQISDMQGKTGYMNGRLCNIINFLNLDFLLVTGDLIKRKSDISKVIKETCQ